MIRSRDVVFLEYQIVGDIKKSDKSQSSSEIPIILTLVSPLIVMMIMEELEKIIMMVQ